MSAVSPSSSSRMPCLAQRRIFVRSVRERRWEQQLRCQVAVFITSMRTKKDPAGLEMAERFPLGLGNRPVVERVSRSQVKRNKTCIMCREREREVHDGNSYDLIAMGSTLAIALVCNKPQAKTPVRLTE